MKIIDLLVKIANEEEVPKYIIYDGYDINEKLTYDEETKDYYNEPECTYGLFDNIHYKLNDEVQILEDTPKEYINVSEEQVLFNNLSYEEQQFILKQMRMLQPCKLKNNGE